MIVLWRASGWKLERPGWIYRGPGRDRARFVTPRHSHCKFQLYQALTPGSVCQGGSPGWGARRPALVTVVASQRSSPLNYPPPLPPTRPPSLQGGSTTHPPPEPAGWVYHTPASRACRVGLPPTRPQSLQGWSTTHPPPEPAGLVYHPPAPRACRAGLPPTRPQSLQGWSMTMT